jgi:hypothetical protein
MSSPSEVLGVRVDRGTVTQLKLLACRLSLEQGEALPWTRLVRQAIERLLAEKASRGARP